jgi:hypothetical protein
MADELLDGQSQPSSNGAASPTPEPTPSLRDIAEAAYDEIAETPDPGAPDNTTGQDGQPRDNLGRFASKEVKPGEQSQDPAPKENSEASGDAKPTDPAPQDGRSNQPPQHWSEQDKQSFAKLAPEGQAFLLRRHTEMERDYQTKTQAAATAVQFASSLAPVFQHPVIAGSLQQAGVSPMEAIGQWAGFHLRAMSPDPQVKAGLLMELAQRMGLNPAAPGQPSQSGPGQLSEADLKDPAIRFFADHIGATSTKLQAIEASIDQMHRQAQEAAQTERMKITRRGIDGFADEKDEKGNLKHPHFDAVLPIMIELYQANPERDLQQAYDMAIWSSPEVRSKLIAAERQAVEQRQANEKARLAVRGNTRGITSPVAKPAGDGKPKSLRETLEAAADEIGL